MNVLHPKPSRAQKAIDLPSSPVGIIKDLEVPTLLWCLKNVITLPYTRKLKKVVLPAYPPSFAMHLDFKMLV